MRLGRELSLRARLTAMLLAVTAVGLLALAAITYAGQRAFLLERVDAQVEAARPVVDRALHARGMDVPGHGDDDPGQRGDGPGAGRGPGGRGREGATLYLPGGVYGARLDGSGRMVGDVVLGESFYDDLQLSPPALPEVLKIGRVQTVAASEGSGEYRLSAFDTLGQPGATIVAIPLGETAQTLRQLLLVLVLVIVGVLAVLAVLSSYAVRVGLRPLDAIGETAGAIAAGDLSRRVTESSAPNTEVGRLSASLNAMLDRLQAAFTAREASERRLRRFLADASHELRTPLASIRGYAELFRLGAASSPEDLDKAMRRIEEEAARMGVLVEDLLALARLDETPTIRRDQVDIAGLAEDAVADARASAPERVIELKLAGRPTVMGDADQLRQILANLLRNAVVHTPARTPIEVAVERDGDLVRTTVRDHGPGLQVDDPSVLFERFWRHSAGRARGPAGSGLGLAIVAAIVAAHGGRVTAENSPDGGALFRVELPEGENG